MTPERKNQLWVLVKTHLNRTLPSEQHERQLFDMLLESPSEPQRAWIRPMIAAYKAALDGVDLDAERRARQQAVQAERTKTQALLDDPDMGGAA